MSEPGSESAALAKAYEPAAVEGAWYARWIERGCFTADPASPKPPYAIVIPPPNVTGVLTLGHVLNNTLQDILARRARMNGREVLWLPGTDHAGIATQTVVERMLRKQGLDRRTLGREAFLAKVWEWKEKHGGIIIRQLKRLGCSCDWTRERFTMDADYSAAVQQAFVELHARGLIYRGKRMVNWCPVSLTALSDEEVIMKPQRGVLYFFRVEVEGEPGTHLTVATTRPETIPGDTAIAVNPRDPRYARFIGKRAVRPLPAELPREAKLIPIVGDDHVDFEFGTGVLKVTPAHDKADFEIGRRHGLAVVDVMEPDGRMNALAGEDLAGLDRFEARECAVEKLKALRQMEKEEPYEHSVGFSERADVPIEPRLSEQWFLRYPKVAESIAAVESGDIRFVPERWAAVYRHWMGNIQDWCISRQLWWGHRIPAWYRLDPGGKRVEPEEVRVSLAPPDDSGAWEQDPDVLDTWFSSWLWPFQTMDGPTRARFYPTDDLVTGPDIIFFWVARMIMAGFAFEGRKPFSNVFFTSIIRDIQGRKMSKSLGNSPDPLDLIAKYGADGLRFGLMRIAPHGQDIRFDEKQIEEGRNFANKLWNACRFRQMHGPSAPEPSVAARSLSIYSLDILDKLRALIARVDAAYGAYRFNEIAQSLYDFFWSEYCDRFVEAAKSEVYGNDPAAKGSALEVMDFVLHRYLRLLHPFMPHLTDELWERMGFAPPPRGALDFAPAPAASEVPAAPPGLAEKVAALYGAAGQARTLRATYRIPSGKKVRFALKPSAGWVEAELGTFARLVNAERVDCDPAFAPAKGTPAAITGIGELFMPLEGLIDVAAERARTAREIAKTEADLAAVRKKLENPRFADHAPAAVVEEHRARETDLAAKLEALGKLAASLED